MSILFKKESSHVLMALLYIRSSPLNKIVLKKKSFTVIGLIILLWFQGISQSAKSLGHLQCEHLINPIGIDARAPRFSWNGTDETAYQIQVSADSTFTSFVWQSKMTGDLISAIYKGRKLQPFTRYYWKVTAWDKKQNKIVSAPAFFETGMIEMKNWKGSWIQDSRDINLKPAPYFRKSFTVAKRIVSARAYIAVAGLYELSINGQRVGDHYLDPMYTRFDRRTMYVSYDITDQIQQGNNAIGVLLGNGWYNHQSTAVWYFDKAPWRARPSFCMDLRITYADGSIETIASGRDWKTSLSPVIFNSIYTAEHYDANKEIKDWNMPGFTDTAWKNAVDVHAPSNNIVAQSLQPVRLVDTLSVKTMVKLSDTVYVFDLGRNIAGISSLRVAGEAGTVVRVKHGERLYKNGHVDQSNIDVHYRPTDDTDPFQTDIYTLDGKEDYFQPHFNYKGFQYVEVTSSKPIHLNASSLTGYFMHSDVPSVGRISSSNPTINKIWEAANNSYLSNLFGYPTDCPQREKNGWTGDASIAVETGLYNFDAITVYEKWMADHRDEQQPNGVLPSIIPTGGWGYDWGNGPDWTSTIAIIPWNLYLFYGDSKILSDCYDNIKRYVDHINYLYPSGVTDWGLGDWIPVKSKSPVELTSTCYYYADVVILARAAKLSGKTVDYKTYTALAEKIKDAFNTKYFDAEQSIYGHGLQTELSVPLFWGIVPDRYKSKVAASLAKRVLADGTKLDVGLLGTKAILNALSENGYADIAYKLASAEEYPSWGYWIKNGATTLYENWPIDAGSDISMNHIMFGEIDAWFYKALGGIKPDPAQPGFKHTLLKPNFPAGLDSFSCYHIGPYGKIASSWKRKGATIDYSITIPANSSATLTIQNKVYQISSGTHNYNIKQ
ncbi:MAG: family 78 glycoside hydrolase catalytic domain [Bacteroidota bacterium]